jgi:hypothetical protein
MSEERCLATGKEKLPCSVYFKNESLHICRGTPSEMVLQMVSSDTTLTVRDAIKVVVDHLASTRKLLVELPWDAPDEVLSNLLLQAMLGSGVVGPTPIS